MVESRWFRRAGPGIAAIGALAIVASTTLGAPERPWEPRPCPGAPRVGTAPAGVWYQLDPVVEAGVRTGQRLVVGGAATGPTRALILDAESFAAGPVGGTVVVGTDDGRRSRSSLIDVDAECAWSLGSSRDVVRAATVAPDGEALFEFRVDRTTRADLGVWRRALDGRGPAVRVLPPIEPDPAFGPTWLTDLTWSQDGAALAVQSCGEVACRFRVLSMTGEAVRTIADVRLGDLVGLSPDRLVAHGACRGLPCPLLVADLADGSVVTLHAAAGQAVLAHDERRGPVVVHEIGVDGTRLRKVDLAGRDLGEMPGDPAGRHLVPGPGRSGGAAEHPRDAVLFGPDGRLPVDGSLGPSLRRLSDGTAVPFDEVP